MEKILSIFGRLMATLYGIFNDMLGGILLYVLLVYMMLFFVNNKTINNVFISELIEDDFDKTRRGARRNKKKADNATMELLMSYGYSGFAGPLTFIIKSVFGMLMAFGLQAETASAIDNTIFNINTAMSLWQHHKAGSPYVWALAGLTIGAIFIQMLHDGYLERRILMDQSAVDVIQVIPLTIMCVLVPSGFIFFYIIYTLIELVQIIFQTTTMHDSGIRRVKQTMNYKKSTFERRYEAQVKSLNEKKKNKK